MQPYRSDTPNWRQPNGCAARVAFRAFVHDHPDDARTRTQLRRHLDSDADLLTWAPGLCCDGLIAPARQAGYTAGFTLDLRRITRAAHTPARPPLPMVERCTPAMRGRLFGANGDSA